MPVGTIPFVTLTGVTVKPTPLQVAAFIAVIAGVGLIVTVTVNVAPGQLPKATDEVGVTVYMAVCTVFVVLVSMPLIFAALLPEAPPLNPVPEGGDQL